MSCEKFLIAFSNYIFDIVTMMSPRRQFDPVSPEQIEAVRRFNRFISVQSGMLKEGLLDSPWTLTEARIIFELAHSDGLTARDLCALLELDPGYVSRILKRLRNADVIERRRSREDARQMQLSLSETGREVFDRLNRASARQTGKLLGPLQRMDRERLIASMNTIEGILGLPESENRGWLLRPHRPGDLGWIVEAHGRLYAEEYGWNAEFEGLVAGIISETVANFDPERHCIWIAERDGERAGSAVVVDSDTTTAKLRLVIVEPSARGLGIGRRLVEECMRFARESGYLRMTLWTNNVLTDARRLYEVLGFRLVHEEAHESFGHQLVGETWERDL
jgi:DNA-binding MarR family transcriptional regulator/GNAT superfamily N-acetyltransferase